MRHKEEGVGVIGGSGLYDLEGFTQVEKVGMETPFGRPSADFVMGEAFGRKVVFIARHGTGHVFTASEINYRANIFGLKKLGVRSILSISAVGSMKEQYCPGDCVVIDQFIDLTRGRANTFFGEGVVGHVSMADPICPDVARLLHDSATKAGLTAHQGGTYVCIEGPQFSSRAESKLYRSWGVDVIGMTNVTEAKLAREAGICYATLAMVCDYDCWHETEDDVSVTNIAEVMRQNAEGARATLKVVLEDFDIKCAYAGTSRQALFTNPDYANAETLERLRVVLD